MGGKASSGGGSDGDEGNVFRQPLKANSRKIAKLKLKVYGGCNVMNDTAMVPRKLRSAMGKRSTYSASPPFPVLKKHAFKSNQSFASSDAKNFSSSKIESITKDEEEVVEALTALAALVPAGKTAKVTVNRGNGEKDSKLKPSSIFEEASKEMASRHLIPLRDSQEETTKAEALAPDEYVTESLHQKIDIQHALASNSRRSAWRRCSAHVYITHLIQNYQNMESNEQPSLLPNPSKYEDGTCSSGGCPFAKMLPLRNGLSGITFDGEDSATTERNASKERFQQDARVPKVQPAQNLVALYSHQQKQVQIQLPHIVGNPFCGQRTVHAGGAAAKQHLWQCNIAHYRPPLSPPQGLPKWQNGRHHHDPLLSSLACSRPSSMFTPPSISVGAVVPAEANHHDMAFLPTSSSSRAVQQQHEGSRGNGEFSMERSPHLQLLCRVQNT